METLREGSEMPRWRQMTCNRKWCGRRGCQCCCLHCTRFGWPESRTSRSRSLAHTMAEQLDKREMLPRRCKCLLQGRGYICRSFWGCTSIIRNQKLLEEQDEENRKRLRDSPERDSGRIVVERGLGWNRTVASPPLWALEREGECSGRLQSRTMLQKTRK